MKYNHKTKYKKGFTIAELLVLILVLSILLAAFAPVFSGKNSASFQNDSVWTYLAGDEDYNIVASQSAETANPQYYVGLTPINSAAILQATNGLYSKLVIRSANSIQGGRIQKHMRFHGDKSESGMRVVTGSLFAGNKNILLGGIYDRITSSAVHNTAFGELALSSLTSGTGNTALGYRAGYSITTGYNNTLIGYNADVETTGYNNTVLGSNSAVTKAGAHDNVLISAKSDGNYDTLILYTGDSESNIELKNSNGYNSFLVNSHLEPSAYANNLSDIGYNTVVGASSFKNPLAGSVYNTIIGANAANSEREFNNITCIGYRSCEKLDNNHIPTGISQAAVFIGRAPVKDSAESNYSGVAALEVYNYASFHYPKIGTTRKWKDVVYYLNPENGYPAYDRTLASLGESYNLDDIEATQGHYFYVKDIIDKPMNSDASGLNKTNAAPYPYSSVVINGNLIVRGQPYFMTKSPLYGGPALVGFTLLQVDSSTDGSRLGYDWDTYDPKGVLPANLMASDVDGGYGTGKTWVLSGMDGAGATNPVFGDYQGTTNPVNCDDEIWEYLHPRPPRTIPSGKCYPDEMSKYSHFAAPHRFKGLRQNCTCARPYYQSDFTTMAYESQSADPYGTSTYTAPKVGNASMDAFHSYDWRYIDDSIVGFFFNQENSPPIETGYNPLKLQYICAGSDSSVKMDSYRYIPRLLGDQIFAFDSCPVGQKYHHSTGETDTTEWDPGEDWYRYYDATTGKLRWGGNPVIGGRYYDYSLGKEYLLDNKYLSVTARSLLDSNYLQGDEVDDFLLTAGTYNGHKVNSSHLHMLPINQAHRASEHAPSGTSMGYYYTLGSRYYNGSGRKNLLDRKYMLFSAIIDRYVFTLHNSAYIDYNIAREMVYPKSKSTYYYTNTHGGCCPPVSHPLGDYKSMSDRVDPFYVPNDANKVLFNWFDQSTHSYRYVPSNRPYGAISDLRLKNVIGELSTGLEELKRLKIYNFTFKGDDAKTPQVGVIAQSLKKVFPNAVSVDEKGYYTIRWEDMLFSAVNAVKELNTKINNLTSRVANDMSRISKLKKDNADLEGRLLELSNELDKIEAKK